MNDAPDNFEAFLRDGLKAVARKAPAPPSVFVLRRALRKRAVARASWASAAAAALIATGLFFAPLLTSQESPVEYWMGALGLKQTPVPEQHFVPGPGGPNLTELPRIAPTPSAPPGPPLQPPPTALVSAFEPLPADPDLPALQADLARYFARYRIHRAEIVKSGGAVDFMFNASGSLDFDQVNLDFETLLKNCGRVEIRLLQGELSCWLLPEPSN